MSKPDRLLPTTGRTLVIWNGDDESMGEIDVIDMAAVSDALAGKEPLEHAECKFNRDGTATRTGTRYRCHVRRLDEMTVDLIYARDAERKDIFIGTMRL